MVNFLKGSSRSGSQEVLLMYYLQRARYSEAVAFNEELNRTTAGSSSSSETRKAIMDRFCRANLIPSTVLAR